MWLRWSLVGIGALVWLALVVHMHALGQPVWAVGMLAFGAAAFTVYGLAPSMAWKYLFPGVAGMLLFVALPLLYTVQIGFTNRSSAHLLDEGMARQYLLAQSRVDEAGLHGFEVRRAADGLRVALQAPGGGATLQSPVLKLDGTAFAADSPPFALQPGAAPGQPLTLRELIPLRPALQSLALRTPDGRELRYAGLREFAPTQPVWNPGADGALIRAADGAVFKPDRRTGWFTAADGATLTPGFEVGIGWDNYRRMLLDPDFRGPFVSIFVWTVMFAALTVVFSTAVGLGLAVLLNWEALSARSRTLYRTLLFLPYAVPGFISILVFKGLFNQNFGEINAILDALFGIRPAWFAEPWLARTMLLIVNTWLGYPYIMVLATGLLKAIPADLYEASALAGAGPWTNFRRITAPLVIKPLLPLLISAFAFNFNNFVLIALLTDGRPDHLNTKLPAGTTDILVSYTYRIAFTDAGQNFGLAAAISTLIFGMVALMALLQLRAMRKVP